MESQTPIRLSPALLEGPTFGEATSAERLAFLCGLDFRKYAPGVEIFTEDEPGNSLWIVNSGIVSRSHRTEAGESVELDRSREGDVFGEMAVISPALRAATARTLTHCGLFVLTRERFRQLLDERDPCAEGLLRYVTLRICRRLRQTDARIALVHEALRGAPAVQLQDRIAELERLARYS